MTENTVALVIALLRELTLQTSKLHAPAAQIRRLKIKEAQAAAAKTQLDDRCVCVFLAIVI